MNMPSYALRDSATMLRRDIQHSLRYPMLAIGGMAVPVFLLLLFVGVFGNTLHAGLAVPHRPAADTSTTWRRGSWS
jgi:ABC-2 type transport system permease protein